MKVKLVYIKCTSYKSIKRLTSESATSMRIENEVM